MLLIVVVIVDVVGEHHHQLGNIIIIGVQNYSQYTPNSPDTLRAHRMRNI